MKTFFPRHMAGLTLLRSAVLSVLLLSTALPMQAFDIWKILDSKKEAYVFAYFKGDGDGLHFAYSLDGLIWKPVADGKRFLDPQAGESKLMRDPSVVQGPDGEFHMVWTTGWTERCIGYAHSSDLVNWSEQKTIPLMENEPTAQNCWAPDLFYDKASRTYYIVWASSLPGRNDRDGGGEYHHRLYYTTTKDFETFAPSRLFYDGGFSVIDGTLYKEGGRLYLFVKDETEEPAQKNIRVLQGKLKNFSKAAVSESLTGNLEWSEGPSVLRVKNYTYLYWDKYRSHRFGAMRTRRIGQPLTTQWEDLSNKARFPEGIRHGSAIKVSEEVLYELLKTE